MNTRKLRRRAARWAAHDAAVPYRVGRTYGAPHIETAVVADTTGAHAGYFGARLGKRISWQVFAELTGRPIPAGAILRPKKLRPPREPKQEPIFWLGRRTRFPRRYTDPAKENRGFPRIGIGRASVPMSVLLKPLSAKDTARHYIASTAVPAAVLKAPIARRNPLAEEHRAGRIDGRLVNGADWFEREIYHAASGRADGMRRSVPGGGKVDCNVRDPLALWPVEAAADMAIRVRLRFRTLGPLARIVVRALCGAEMAELAPAWNFPQRHKAEAGRIRLRAGLEICARMAERDVDSLPQWEVLQVVQAACAECVKLQATRRMRVPLAANDNNRQIAAA